MAKTYIPSDPLFSQQWHLLNTGQDIMGRPQAEGAYRNDINVTGVWPDYTGAGVTVAVMDDGFQAVHPDLAPNYLADQSYSFSASPGAGVHGTSTMGLIIAAQNDIGGVGVAYGAKGIGYTIGAPQSSFARAAAFMIESGVSVSSNSWHATRNDANFYEKEIFNSAFLNTVQFGRGGLGIVNVFSANNDRENGGNTNLELTSSSPYAITVAAANVDGTVTVYSNPGASILVSAPGGGWYYSGDSKDIASIVTTDLMGSAGLNKSVDGDYTNVTDINSHGFNGTSASAPIVAGVVALMLEANPNLGYRDVQEILAYSAATPDGVTDWSVNGASDWNGGGHRYSNDLGFGLVDALAAVRLAETWVKQSTYANLVTVGSPFPGDDPFDLNTIIQAGETRSLSVELSSAVRAQHVRVEVTIELPSGVQSLSGVTLTLTGPDGHTTSRLLEPTATSNGNMLTLTFDTVHDWGEISSSGSWILTVANADNNPELKFNASVSVSGDAVTDGQTFIYTDDYAHLAGDGTGRALLDPAGSGIHTLNAAAVTTDTIVDLSAHTARIAGVDTAIGEAVRVGTIITGDGADTLVGDSHDTVFFSGRGANTIDGGDGIDTLWLLGKLADYSQAGAGAHTVLAGASSHDSFTGIEKLQFADGVLTLDTNLLVDDVFYAKQVAGLLDSGQTAEAHYEAVGWREGLDPNALFSTGAYLANHANVRAAGVDPLSYYSETGWKNGDDPSAWFDTSLYLKLNPDVAASGVDPLTHYLQQGMAEGREARPVVDSGKLVGEAFDPTFYRLANPDVALNGMDAYTHWLTYGLHEGRDPNAYFDTSWYLAQNTDVAAAGVDPLAHYLQYGWKEGRDPSANFDGDAYLAEYTDVRDAGFDPLVHYLRYGIGEGRQADWDFA